MTGDGHALVVGLGRSGRAALRVLTDEGRACWAVDDNAEVLADLPASTTLLSRRSALEKVSEAAFVVASPGVDREHPVLLRALKAGVPVLSEIELAARRLQAPVLAVTGTNGKSTTVSLLGEILAATGASVFVGGNLGRPLAEAVGSSWDWIVVEVSSFQLEWVDRFKPQVAALLNISADHIDRHRGLQGYRQAKLRVFDNAAVAVVDRDDPWAVETVGVGTPALCTFGRSGISDGDGGVRVDPVARTISGNDGYSVELPPNWPLVAHDLDNAAAACAVARAVGVDAAGAAHGLAAYQPLPHRLARVAVVDGVEYWNDSKATNVGATLSSLASMQRPSVLLAGGVGKGADFGPLARAHNEIKLVVAYGQAGPAIRAALEGQVDVELVPGFDAAFELARIRAVPGDPILLAPACASFDEFADYAERGRRFVDRVEALQDGSNRD